jgi:YD repeat-containing protein
MLAARRTTTDAGNVVYDTGFDYDAHRRTNLVDNVLEVDGQPQTVASYTFTYDLHGNPLTLDRTTPCQGLTQTATGAADFAGDDRTFTPDNLDRLVATDYAETDSTEETVLDVVGNRESQTDRAGVTTAYGVVDAANEYTSVAGAAVSYDEADNLIVDEDGRQYTYDEQNRLTEVRDAGDVLLASYAYDALGRRVSSTIGTQATRYYYDGQRVIEERDGDYVLLREQINGSQFIDEHIATHEAGAANGSGRVQGWTYYLSNANYSVAGMGNSEGTLIQRLDFSSSGDFPVAEPLCQPCDANCDGVVDLDDDAAFQALLAGGTPCSWCAGRP